MGVRFLPQSGRHQEAPSRGLDPFVLVKPSFMARVPVMPAKLAPHSIREEESRRPHGFRFKP